MWPFAEIFLHGILILPKCMYWLLALYLKIPITRVILLYFKLVQIPTRQCSRVVEPGNITVLLIVLTKNLLLSLELLDSTSLVSLKLPSLSPPSPTHTTLARHQGKLLAPVQPVWGYLGNNFFSQVWQWHEHRMSYVYLKENNKRYSFDTIRGRKNLLTWMTDKNNQFLPGCKPTQQ